MDPKMIYEQWLNDPFIDEATKKELEGIKGNDKEIEDRFYMDLEFGTAGLRGVLGAGINRMNNYTVAKATQGLADYINTYFETQEGKADTHEKSVAIACDSRHFSKEFSRLTALVLNANGIKAYIFTDMRPTPELSFAIRYLNCIAGVNITASHNPAEYNGYKAYWSDGAQITPPHDAGIMEYVKKVDVVPGREHSPKILDKETELFVNIDKEVDEAYLKVVLDQVKAPEAIAKAADSLKIVYTPLHGAGITIVPEALKRAGFTNVMVVKEQAVPDGSFPTVDYPNPESAAAFALADKLAKETGADLAIATDPDADRIGVHLRDSEGNYHELTGNQIGAIMCEYQLARRKEAGPLPEGSFIVRSIVSGKMTDLIGAAYGVENVHVLTGFKNIGKAILEREDAGKGKYLFGFEESYGFLTGSYARDKDACSAAVVFCEMAAYSKAQGKTLWDSVQELFSTYGYFKEETVSITKKGIDGMKEIKEDMQYFRDNPIESAGGLKVLKIRDYLKSEETGLDPSNVLYYELENDSFAAVRPSGTEPKIKYYVGIKGKDEAEAAKVLEAVKADLVR